MPFMLCISRGATRPAWEAVWDGYMCFHSYERPLHDAPGHPDRSPSCLQVPQLPKGLPDAQWVHPEWTFHKMERCGWLSCLHVSLGQAQGLGISEGCLHVLKRTGWVLWLPVSAHWEEGEWRNSSHLSLSVTQMFNYLLVGFSKYSQE